LIFLPRERRRNYFRLHRDQQRLREKLGNFQKEAL
jgi:hypothetical protein